MIRPLIEDVQNLKSISYSCFGSQYYPLTNMDMKGNYKNHCVDFEEAFKRACQAEFSLSGIIQELNPLRLAFFLKLIDLGNFIDTHKVYLNFKDDLDFERY